MRLALLALALPIGVFVLLVLLNTVFRPPPADERLAGVGVTIAGYRIERPTDGADARLHLTVDMTSARELQECMAFALDQQFASRRVTVADGTCARPRVGETRLELIFERLSDDDLAFPSHTLVWGVAGGRCGLILELFGVCVVDMAGTVELELPRPPGLPSFPPLGSFPPLFSFEPIR